MLSFKSAPQVQIQRLVSCVGWGLTPRSSGEPTARRLAREAATLIISLAGQPSHRRPPLSSNVRQRRARSSDCRCLAEQPVHGPAFPQLASGRGLFSSRSRTDAVIQVATAPASGRCDLPALRFRLAAPGYPDRVAVHCRDLSLLQPFDAGHCVGGQVVLPAGRAAGYCSKPSKYVPGGWNTWRTSAYPRAAGGSRCPQETCAPTPGSHPMRCLTPRSSGEPTACRLAREAVLVIIGLAGQSSHRRLPLSSNVRLHE